MADEQDVTVNIDKAKAGVDAVTVAVNGSIKQVSTGSDQKVSAAIAGALANSHVVHTIVDDANGGSGSGVGSEPSTTLENTAIRDHAQDVPEQQSISAEPQPLIGADEPEHEDAPAADDAEFEASKENPATGGTLNDLAGIVADTDDRAELEKMLASEQRSGGKTLIQKKLDSLDK